MVTPSVGRKMRVICASDRLALGLSEVISLSFQVVTWPSQILAIASRLRLSDEC